MFACSSSAPAAGQCQQQQVCRKPREFTRWSTEESKIVINYFRSFVTGSGLPRKPEVKAFMEQYPDIKHHWTKIRTKVFNEQKACVKRMQKELDNVRI